MFKSVRDSGMPDVDLSHSRDPTLIRSMNQIQREGLLSPVNQLTGQRSKSNLRVNLEPLASKMLSRASFEVMPNYDVLSHTQ